MTHKFRVDGVEYVLDPRRGLVENTRTLDDTIVLGDKELEMYRTNQASFFLYMADVLRGGERIGGLRRV